MSDRTEEQCECKKCHELYELGGGLDPSDYCNTCAQELVDTLTSERDQLKARVAKLEIERDEALVAKDFANLACEKLEARLEEARWLLEYDPNLEDVGIDEFQKRRLTWLSARTPIGKDSK